MNFLVKMSNVSSGVKVRIPPFTSFNDRRILLWRELLKHDERISVPSPPPKKVIFRNLELDNNYFVLRIAVQKCAIVPTRSICVREILWKCNPELPLYHLGLVGGVAATTVGA